jgi:hypothetical protein
MAFPEISRIYIILDFMKSGGMPGFCLKAVLLRIFQKLFKQYNRQMPSYLFIEMYVWSERWEEVLEAGLEELYF